MDAAGYDTVLEEVNKNWLDAAMKWSYLEQTKDATIKAVKNWREKNKDRPPSDPLSRTERLFMDHMLSLEPTANDPNKFTMRAFTSKIRNIVPLPKDKKEADGIVYSIANTLQKEMKAVGYDVYNPPETATWLMQKTFVNVLNRETKLASQFDKAISRTENNKRELMKEIRKSGPVYQYYAH